MQVCVIDAKKGTVKLALFKNDKLLKVYTRKEDFDFETHLPALLTSEQIKHIFLAADDQAIKQRLESIAKGASASVASPELSRLKMQASDDHPSPLTLQKAANGYGALSIFPSANCIIIDIDQSVSIDLVTKEGSYLGGTLYPGLEMSEKALASFMGIEPAANVTRPQSPCSRDGQGQIESGLYYGLLGAIERIVAEMNQAGGCSYNAKVIATGAFTDIDREDVTDQELLSHEDLKDLTDLIAPHLALVGLYEIFKEQTKDNVTE